MSCYWKILIQFQLQKKRPENAFLMPNVNGRKIMQKNNLCYQKRQQIGYLMAYHVI